MPPGDYTEQRKCTCKPKKKTAQNPTTKFENKRTMLQLNLIVDS